MAFLVHINCHVTLSSKVMKLPHLCREMVRISNHPTNQFLYLATGQRKYLDTAGHDVFMRNLVKNTEHVLPQLSCSEAIIRQLTILLNQNTGLHQCSQTQWGQETMQDCCSDTALLTFYCVWLAIKTNDTTTWQQWVPTPTLVAPAPTGTPTLGESLYLLHHATPLPVM